MVKQRKISKKDWESVERFVKDELSRRKTSEFRKSAEERWKEVDRQLRMTPLSRISVDGKTLPPGWQSTIELGEISKVSEIISADVMRITFPAERDWFEPHVELEGQPDESGREVVDPKIQMIADNTVKNMFSQQHQDFSFKRRFELSEKEALHHGSFVATAEWYEDMMVMDGSKVKHIGAPVWVPHSMWNCYPDDSPRCVTQNMFYQGSMIIETYMPRWKLEMQSGEGWMPAQFSRIPDDEHQVGEHGQKRTTKDLRIVTYYGDVVITRKATEDIYLPNSKVILANDVIVFWDTNDLPYPPVIYGGYEKQDPRDPYFTSPIVKLSAMGKMATVLANEFIDSIRLHTQPPIVYDGTDPEFVANGGPTIAPGASSATRGEASFKELAIGEPSAALSGLEMTLRVMQEGTGVSAVRSGTPNSDRQTATEVQKIAQGAEVRTVDFIEKLSGYLRTFLYMQHALNLKKMKEYTFYSDDMDSRDFIRLTASEYRSAPVIHFDVVGAKGILGEEQRMTRQMNVTAFASANPLFAPYLQETARELLISMYRDAGTKNPERFVGQAQQEDPRLAQAMQAIQELQAQIQELSKDREVKIAAIQQKDQQSQRELEFDKISRRLDFIEHAQTLATQQNTEFAKLMAQKETAEKKEDSDGD